MKSKVILFVLKIKLEIWLIFLKCKKGIYMYLFEKLYIKNRIIKVYDRIINWFNMKLKGKILLI